MRLTLLGTLAILAVLLLTGTLAELALSTSDRQGES